MGHTLELRFPWFFISATPCNTRNRTHKGRTVKKSSLACQEYIHRVGRTARGASGKGKALLFLMPEETGSLHSREREVRVRALGDVCESCESTLGAWLSALFAPRRRSCGRVQLPLK